MENKNEEFQVVFGKFCIECGKWFMRNKKDIGIALVLLCSVIAVIGNIVVSILNPDLTDTRLFLMYWRYIVLWLAWVLLGLYLTKK